MTPETSRRRPRSHRWLLTTLLLICGCGGGEPPPLPVAPAPPPPPPAAPASPPAARPAPRPAAQASVPRETLELGSLPSSYLAGEPVPNFTATIPALRIGEEVYAAIPPRPGVTTNQFVARLPSPATPPVPLNPAFRLPAGFTVVSAAGNDPQGIPRRIRCERDGSEMVLIPAGACLVGKEGRSPEVGPAHLVYLDAYYMDVHEVTVGRYLTFREENLSRRPQPPLNPSAPPEMPAVGVSWRDAQLYARWVGKELPTEAEWEKAGRGEHGFDYPWGNDRPLWAAPRQPGQIDPVGSYPADRSIYGVMDLAGNVREWCSDWYAEDAYQKRRRADGAPVPNPTGPERPSRPNLRVVKGAGSEGWQLWSRSGASMSETLPDLGFRCVLRLTIPPSATNPPQRDF